MRGNSKVWHKALFQEDCLRKEGERIEGEEFLFVRKNGRFREVWIWIERRILFEIGYDLIMGLPWWFSGKTICL